MSHNPVFSARFDTTAQERITSRFRRCPPEEFLRELAGFEPTNRAETVVFEKFFGWALYESGDYASAREHLLRALRFSAPRSRDRAIVRGLLGELYLRTGDLAHAERCAHRALTQIPVEDEGGYLRSGHLGMLGRIQRRLGHLTHAIETYRRALAIADEASPHRASITASLALALFQRGQVHEADTLVRALRRSTEAAGGASQDWSIASVEAQVALALGDLGRAGEVLDRALAGQRETGSERVRMVLLDLRSAVWRAHGEWARAEETLRTVLSRCEPGGRNGDIVACASRGLAESLEGQQRFEEALEPARLAIRSGCIEDRVEWVTGLHVLGRCLAALGRHDQARAVFLEAIGVHERTQFDAERARLEHTLIRLGFEDLRRVLGGDADAPMPGPEPCEPIVVPMREERRFLTCDAQLLEHVRAAARGELPVLIEGETGTGKELIARLVHELGPRAHGPFVVVDCATLPPELADVELFGATRGAYTGAHRERPGLIAQAHRGTLFLDELPELSPALQAKLLRVIQDGTYRRIGEDRSRRIEVRFVAATNREVDVLLRTGRLKPDLFHRLNGYRISLLPLRQRRAEIAPLATSIARRAGLAGITPAARRELEAHDWPGNVRQLEMVLRVAAGRCAPGGWLDREHLEFRRERGPAASENEDSLRAGRAAGERALLMRALQENGGTVAGAARALGLSRQALYKAMQRTGITAATLSEDRATPV